MLQNAHYFAHSFFVTYYRKCDIFAANYFKPKNNTLFY